MFKNALVLGTTTTLETVLNGRLEAPVSFLAVELFGISLYQYLLAFFALLLAFIAQRILLYLIQTKLASLVSKTRTEIDDALIGAISKPLGYLVVICGFFVAGVVLTLPEVPVNLKKFYFSVFKTLLAIDIAWLAVRLVDVLMVFLGKISKRTDTRLDDELIPIFRKTLKVFVGLIAFVIILQTIGYSITGIVAGLGIGGLAIALAAQDVLSNIFGSIVIFTDRPFRSGDWIVAGDVEGVVEEVGFRSTKIRTFAKTLVTVPNKKIADLAIDNFSRMPKRRVKITVGVTYETSADQMEKAVKKIREILRNHEEVDQEFFLVYFTDFGDSSLNILVYYFTRTIVWAEYLHVREEINLTIMRELEKLGSFYSVPNTDRIFKV